MKLKTSKLFPCALASMALGLAAQAAYCAEPAGDPSPFPPGPNAMLVKQTCSQCHSPNVVVTQTFTPLSARKIYQKMLGESPDSERSKKSWITFPRSSEKRKTTKAEIYRVWWQ